MNNPGNSSKTKNKNEPGKFFFQLTITYNIAHTIRSDLPGCSGSSGTDQNGDVP